MSAPEKPENSAAARQVADWKFVRPLGKGGMAEVFEVENARIGTHAALKLFSCAKDASGEVRARFLAEAALLARLSHPRLVRVFDYGIDPATDRPYFLMDLVLAPAGSSKTLADKDFVGADEEHVAMWYEDLRDALAFIHARGIVHRDVKLQNVLVGPDGHAVLSDFGIAKIFDTSLREKVGLSPEETLHAAMERRTVMGSLGYMAPELEMGVAASPASDYYALGVLVFYLLTGTWCEPRTDILAELETYNPVWKEILPKLLHSNPAARECPSWRECEEREHEKEMSEWEAQADSFRHAIRAVRRRSLVSLFLAGLLGIGLIGIAGVRLLGSHDAPPPHVKKTAPSVKLKDICYVPKDLPNEFQRRDISKALSPVRRDVSKWIRYLNRGEISYRAAIDALDYIHVYPPEDQYIREYQYLLDVAISNLEERAFQ